MTGNGSNEYGPERLRVYHLALSFAQQIDRMLRNARVSSARADQIVRAAESIILNIAEGAGHFSPPKKRYHYQIAYASAFECIAALTKLKGMYPHLEKVGPHRTANMICVMLLALLKRPDP